MNEKTQQAERQKSDPVKSRTLFVISTVVIVGLAAYNIWLMRPLRLAGQEVKDLKTVVGEGADLIQQVPKLLSQVEERISDLKAESKPILSRLQHARELDDLQGIVGEKIVSFYSYRKGGQKIYFYVPAGGHRLNYSQHVVEGVNSVQLGSGEFDRRNANMKTIDLKPETRYEIRLSELSDEAGPSFRLIGPAGTVAKKSLGFRPQPKRVRIRAEQTCFPSQLSREATFDHARSYATAIDEVVKNGSPRLPVEIAVVRYEYPEQRAIARFFIDSDAKANVPVEALLDLMYLQDPDALATRLEQFDRYDGSGRYYFRREAN